MMTIPFNKPFLTGKEMDNIKISLEKKNLMGDGPFTKKCQQFIEEKYGTKKTLLTTSCTKALEMAYLLSGVQPGDEIIMPSFAFVSAASALMTQGAKPVFVEVREDTLNIDESKIEAAITPKTKAILVVHYGGVACEMDSIINIAQKHNLMVIEDAAQAIGSTYKGKFLGTIGDLGCYSFHETKNVICGEGGALNINNPQLIERAEIIWEKGTNRKKFLRGQVDKYTWIDVGSSYLMSDLLAAFLYPQLEAVNEITDRRKKAYEYYYHNLKELENKNLLKLPWIPYECGTNYHLFHLLFPTAEERNRVMDELKKRNISAYFHFVPLHNSPMGKKLGYNDGDLFLTESISSRLLRLPLFNEITKEEQDYVIENLKEVLLEKSSNKN